MKTRFSMFAFSCLALLLGSCHSEEGNEPTPEPQGGSQIRINVATNSYTRAGEDAISSLYIAFYNGDNCLGVKKATGSGTSFTCDVPDNTKPTGLIAYANIEQSLVPQSAPSSITTTINGHGDETNLLMSSARYFDSEKDMLVTPLTTENLVEGGTPVTIHLERVAAKVSFTYENGGKYNFTEGTAQIKASIDSWGITAIDAESYLVKQPASFSSINSELSGWSTWNAPGSFISHWAHSVNHNLSSEKYSDGLSTADVKVIYATGNTLVDVDDTPSILTTESTRPLSVIANSNAIPSVVIKGWYDILNQEAGADLYRTKKGIMTEDQLINSITVFNRPNGADNAYIKENILDFAKPESNVAPSNYRFLKVKTGVISNLYKPDGTKWQESETNLFNSLLLEEFGYMEKYEKGQFCFIVPIKHLGPANSIAEYGIVRNHHYTVNLKNISGLGIGIADPKGEQNSPIVSYDDSNLPTVKYNVNATVSVSDWSKVPTQNIDDLGK